MGTGWCKEPATELGASQTCFFMLPKADLQLSCTRKACLEEENH